MKKKLLAIILCLVFIMVPVASVTASANTTGYTEDATTQTDTVSTVEGFLAVAELVNTTKSDYNITLAADLDFTDKTFTPIGTEGVKYNAVFDGAGHTIKNITFSSTEKTVFGIVAFAGKNCTVKNLTVTDISVTTKGDAGFIVGKSLDDKNLDPTTTLTVDNVHVRKATMKVSGNSYAYNGGIVGATGALVTTISNSTVSVTITTTARASGVLGGETVPSSDANGQTLTGHRIDINNVIVTGSATSTCSKADTGATGILGYYSTIPVSITNCISVIDAKHTAANSTVMGSFLWYINKTLPLTISNCIGVSAPIGYIKDLTLGTAANISSTSIYDLEATADTSALLLKAYTGTETITLDGAADTKWADAKLPVIKTKDALVAKATAMFANNQVVTNDMISELLGHEHAYTAEVVAPAYEKVPVSCTAPGEYYKSCVCGKTDKSATFVGGTPTGHKMSEQWTDSETEHWHICENCLEEKSDVAAHTFGDWVVTKEATEKKEGERVKSCTVCGYEATETIAKVTPAATTATEEKGCGSIVIGSSAVLVAVLGVGAVCLTKKKED